MSRFPPTILASVSRGLAAGHRCATAAPLFVAAAVAMTSVGCDTSRNEDLAGLVVVSAGSVQVTNAAGEAVKVSGAPDGVRRGTAANGRIAVETGDGDYHVSDPPAAGGARTWRSLTTQSSAVPSAGMDLSPDGHLLAIVFGDPDMPTLQLETIPVDGGDPAVHDVGLMANGPPSWLGERLIGLEVIRPDQHSGVATVDPSSGDVTITTAGGIAPSATRDGARVAVADTSSAEVGIAEVTAWLAGREDGAPAIAPIPDSGVQDIALDADGTRLAIAYTASSGTTSAVVILRLEDTVWQTESMIPIQGDQAVAIDWLD